MPYTGATQHGTVVGTIRTSGSVIEIMYWSPWRNPETMAKDRIVNKMKEGQDFDVGKHNIEIRSFSGMVYVLLLIIIIMTIGKLLLLPSVTDHRKHRKELFG